MGKKQTIEAVTPSHDRIGSRIMSEWDICPHCGGTNKRTYIVEDDGEGVLKCDVCGVEFIANAQEQRPEGYAASGCSASGGVR